MKLTKFYLFEMLVLIRVITSVLILLTASKSTYCSYGSQILEEKVYYIAINKSSCLQNNKYSACNTLSYYVQKSSNYFTNYSKFEFQNGIHLLENNLSLSVFDISNLTLTVEEDGEVSINCNGSFSLNFVFKHVQNLIIENLKFSDCRAQSNESSSQHPTGWNSILSIVYCKNIQLNLVKIQRTQGMGIYLLNAIGRVILQGIEIMNGSTQINASTTLFFESCEQSSHTSISHSCFKNNINTATSISSAGGLQITFSNCSRARVDITQVHFSGNVGGNGGNLNIRFIHSPLDYSTESRSMLIIDKCVFEHGKGLVGGAIYIQNKYVSTKRTKYGCTQGPLDVFATEISLLLISKSKFSHNHANYTGGALILKNKNPLSLSCVTQVINISSCHFNHNYLRYRGAGGSAVSTFNFMFQTFKEHYEPQIYILITNTTFTGNFLKVSKGKVDESGSGVILVKSHKHVELTDIIIDSNNCSGILALDSNIVIGGTVTISNNIGYSGGGLLICQNAVLFLKQGSTLNIESNRAHHSGGGILVEPECAQSKPICFYQFASRNEKGFDANPIRINLINNTAKYAGDQLFGGDVDYCYMIESMNNSEKSSLDVYIQLFNIQPNFTTVSKMKSSVTSMPRRVLFQDWEDNNSSINCSSDIHCSIEVYPGEKFAISAVIVGQLNGLVPGTVNTVINSNKHSSLGKIDVLQCINDHQQKLKYAVSSRENHVTLLLEIEQSVDYSVLAHIPNAEKVKIEVMLKECPVGFELSQQPPYECICNRLFRDYGKITCNITNHSIYRHENTWLGSKKDKGGTIVTFYSNSCPVNYCSTKNNISLHADSDIIDQDVQCLHNRTGFVCGGCPNGMSTVGGAKCRSDCSNFGVFYIMLYFVIIMGTVALMILFNITITEGDISGIIFYANIVNIHNNIFFRENSFINPLQDILSFINIEGGKRTCLYKGMDTYSGAWMAYFSPIVLWLITALIIYLSKKSNLIMKLVGKNAVKVLATIILLSYTKLIQTTLISLHFQTLYTFNTATKELSTMKRWFADANVEYLEGKHIPIFIAGVFFGALCIGFTVSLLCIQQLQKVSHLYLFSWVIKFKPFFDAYTGPFSSRARFWTGLLLFIRITLVAVTSLNLMGKDINNVIATILILGILLVLAWFIRPGIYQKWSHDLLECSFLLNLLLLCTGTVYIAQGKSEKRSEMWQQILTAVSATIAIATCVGVVLYHIWLTVMKLSCTKLIITRCKQHLNFNQHQNYSSQLSPEEDTDFDIQFPPLARFNSDREPLLVD